jgi:hypothetical protein
VTLADDGPLAAPARTCPVCAVNYGGLIDPGCRFCGGVGIVELGALANDADQVCASAVARAVTFYATEHGINRGHWTPDHDEATATVRARLVAAGFLAGPEDAAGIVGGATFIVDPVEDLARDKAAQRDALALEVHNVGTEWTGPTATRSAAGRAAAKLLATLGLGARARPAGRVGPTEVYGTNGDGTGHVTQQPDPVARQAYIDEAATAAEAHLRAELTGGRHLQAVPS